MVDFMMFCLFYVLGLVYTITNLSVEIYDVLAVLAILPRRHANQPLEVSAEVTLTDEPRLGRDLFDRPAFSE
jgi:hypothetical protein